MYETIDTRNTNLHTHNTTQTRSCPISTVRDEHRYTNYLPTTSVQKRLNSAKEDYQNANQEQSSVHKNRSDKPQKLNRDRLYKYDKINQTSREWPHDNALECPISGHKGKKTKHHQDAGLQGCTADNPRQVIKLSGIKIEESVA